MKNKLFFVTILIMIVTFCNKLSAQSLSFKEGEFKQWAQTPPMGWNSWDCYGSTVTEDEVKANADYMAANLKSYGWEYIVVDIRWFVENDKAGGYNETNPAYVMDQYGRYMPTPNRFPSAKDGKGFKALADYIHSKGLKFGIHIMRGIPKEAVAKKMPVKGTNGITADQIYTTDLQCQWLHDNYTIVADKPGAQEYYNSIFELYASWGVDFIKIDDLSRPYHQGEIDLIRHAIDNCGRPIVLSTSPGETPIEKAEHVRSHANMWRMVDDVWDTWPHITHLFDICQKWYPYIAPGTWPDCDMIPLGRIAIRGERGTDRMTRLTKDEQYTLMTLFTIFRSPLMFGGDLPSNNPFTLSLLTNKEVLKMHREGTNVRQLYNKDMTVAITSKNSKTGEIYLALFNLSDDKTAKEVSVNLDELGIKGKCSVTDMWQGKNMGSFSGKFAQSLNSHACGLYKLKAKPAKANPVAIKKDCSAYLFVYFTGNSGNEESLRFAVSNDGYSFYALNKNEPVLNSKEISSTGGVRDPHILRGEDGKTFYMVMTDMVCANGWDSNRAMVLLKSTDLINWQHSVVNIQKRYSGQEDLKRVWAPQTIFDREAGKYMVYWSMKYGDGPDIIYYAYANKDFTDLEGEPKPLFLPANGKSCIDGDIIYKDGVFHLFYKTEGHGNGIKKATSRSLISGQWTEQDDYKQQTSDAVEGAGVFKMNNSDKYILMYDVYMKGAYQFTQSTDLDNFRVIDGKVKMNFHPRHGTVIPITSRELKALTKKWGRPDGF